MKTLLTKRLNRSEKEMQILFALIELYVKTGKPIGSQTLQKQEFEKLSPATIRNYLGQLEEKGYLLQQHASGGRIPTGKAFKSYAESLQQIKAEEIKNFPDGDKRTREVKALIHQITEKISEQLEISAIASFPIFEQDFIQKIKCLSIDSETLICILITDYGQIRSEIFYNMNAPSTKILEKTEQYFLWRIGKGKKPLFEIEKDFIFARKIYTEIMLRHALVFGNSLKNNLHKTGLSYLMNYPELNNTNDLSASLMLFENDDALATLLKKTMEEKKLSFWIGEELFPYLKKQSHFSLIAIPYFINLTPAGAIALFGPERLDYKKIFRILKGFSMKLSKNLSQNVYKHKIPFRSSLEEERIDSVCSILLEDKSQT